MERRIRREVEELLNEFSELNGKAVNPTDLTTTSVFNVIVSIIFGKRYQLTDPKLDEFLSVLRQMVREIVDPMAMNIFPFLRFLPKYKKVLQRCHELDAKIFELIEERIQESLSGETEESFISCFVQEDGPEYDRKQLMYTLRDLFLAGTETTSTTLQWFLVYMANNPEVQTRLQKEIDAVVPRSRFPSLDDKSKLTYVEATTLELMRIKTIVPLSLPRLTMCNTEVAGFSIPANCLVSTRLNMCVVFI